MITNGFLCEIKCEMIYDIYNIIYKTISNLIFDSENYPEFMRFFASRSHV